MPAALVDTPVVARGESHIADASARAPAPGGGGGDLAELIGAFNEVTARLTESHEALQGEVARLQRELREASAEVERSRRLAALGEMAAGIAHEVRNPLGSIALYARMLRSDLPEASEERELATRIGRSVRDLDAIVTDVLAFAREIRTRMVVTDVEALLARAVESCAGLAAELDVEVTVEPPAPGAGELVCDPVQVQQALVNVVRNAVQAAAEGAGTVAVTAFAEGVGRGRSRGGSRGGSRGSRGGSRGESRGGGRGGSAGEVAVRVADTGPGIPPEAIERMFNPFFTTRATGSGLGLAIVHRIVDAHGGRVVVDGGGAGASRGDGGCAGAVVELRFPKHGPEGEPP